VLCGPCLLSTPRAGEAMNSDSLMRDGKLWQALVVLPSVNYHRVFHHPLFVGKRFELEPHGSALTLHEEKLVSISKDIPPEWCRRNGCLYEAALRAGTKNEWGALVRGPIYYLWAIVGNESQNPMKAFGLRQPTDGTTPFLYDDEKDCLVRQPLWLNELGHHESRGKAKVPNVKFDAPSIPSREELRQKRLASMGETASTSTTRKPEHSNATRPIFGSGSLVETESLRFLEEPVDQISVFAGDDVVLKIKVQSSFVEALSFQWYHFHTPILGATRPALRLSPLGVVQEGQYFCMVFAGSHILKSRSCVVSFAPLDRYILESLEEVLSAAEEMLPSIDSVVDAHDASHIDADHSSREQHVTNAKALIGKIKAALNLSHAHEFGSPSVIQRRASKLQDQLPCEVCGLLSLRARAHLICALWAPSARMNKGEATEHAHQSRRDAMTALKVIPGDRDALRAHSAASQFVGRLGDAVRSLEVLLRITSEASPLHHQYRKLAKHLQHNLDQEWKRYRAEAESNFKQKCCGDGFKGWHGQPSSEEDKTDDSPRQKEQSQRHMPEAAIPTDKSTPETTDGIGKNWLEVFDMQEECWMAFVRRLREGAWTVNSFHDVPWPESRLRGFHYVGKSNDASRQEKRKAIKKMLLRWHPDKFVTLISKYASVSVLPYMFLSCPASHKFSRIFIHVA
jgi:hypothetical protein